MAETHKYKIGDYVRIRATIEVHAYWHLRPGRVVETYPGRVQVHFGTYTNEQIIDEHLLEPTAKEDYLVAMLAGA